MSYPDNPDDILMLDVCAGIDLLANAVTPAFIAALEGMDPGGNAVQFWNEVVRDSRVLLSRQMDALMAPLPGMEVTA